MPYYAGKGQFRVRRLGAWGPVMQAVTRMAAACGACAPGTRYGAARNPQLILFSREHMGALMVLLAVAG
jgi:hypothetical protein